MSKFLHALTSCRTIDEVDKLLRVKTQRWRGKQLIPRNVADVEEDSEGEEGVLAGEYSGLALLA